MISAKVAPILLRSFRKLSKTINTLQYKFTKELSTPKPIESYTLQMLYDAPTDITSYEVYDQNKQSLMNIEIDKNGKFKTFFYPCCANRIISSELLKEIVNKVEALLIQEERDDKKYFGEYRI